ncbi:hypothetical protein C6P45_001488 [Maudiozyma exigua]|uniref:Bud emergence protein 4 n=1 Tax=Maudiozyma exigua TaxID=34358 RepID=A0A9P6WD63_MAUEX|nr:hypothetical protein C6P45_001488 [Kazachstania exigua]
MEYEDILFGLQTILNAESVKDIPLQDVYLDSYLTVMDQLAVSLRSPSNRDIVGQTGLLSNLLRVLSNLLDVCFQEDTLQNERIAYFKLASELIRCIANCLVDNDANREIFLDNPSEIGKRNVIIDYYVGRILSLIDLPNDETDLVSSLQTRTIVMLRNLCLDNETYHKRVAQYVRGPLYSMLKANQHVFSENIDSVLLGSELLEELIEVYSDGFAMNDILFFAQTVLVISKSVPEDIVISEEKDHENEIEEDPTVELLGTIVQCLEIIVKKNDEEGVKYIGLDNVVSGAQKALLQALTILGNKTFQNKMITMRRLVSISGYISANESISNKDDRSLSFSIIENPTDSYSLAAAFVILSNSVDSRKDADSLLKQISLEKIIMSTKGNITDPIQFSGFLDLLRKVLSTSNAMFLPITVISDLILVLKICHDQTKYFQSLQPLLMNLLKKLFVVLPSSSIYSLVNDDLTSAPILQIISESGCLIACLVLDKLLVSKKSSSKDLQLKLWDIVFSFKDPSNQEGIPLDILFQITKTIGIYLRNLDLNIIEENYLFENYHEKLTEILQTIHNMKGQDGNAVASVTNNGKFIAGMIRSVLDKKVSLTEYEQILRNVSSEYF